MSDPVVLITGALTGIGRATTLVKELRAAGGEAEFIRADVRQEDDVRSLVDQTVAHFGRLDVAANNAGTEGQPGPVTQQTAESYAATSDTNLLGTLLSLKHELRVMQPQGSGSIVNISSTYGHEGAVLGRAGTADELARAILFVASDKASFLTGRIVTVDGGKTAG